MTQRSPRLRFAAHVRSRIVSASSAMKSANGLGPVCGGPATSVMSLQPGFLDLLAAGEPVLERVPVRHLGLRDQPAQEHQSVPHQRVEVHEPTVEVLEHDALGVQLLHAPADRLAEAAALLLQRAQLARVRVVGRGARRGHEQDAHALLEPVELALLHDQALDPRAYLGRRLVGFLHREQLDPQARPPARFSPQCPCFPLASPAFSVSNDLPQPHERTALGLRIANPVASSVSTQSTWTPWRTGALCGSTNTFTPPNSPTQSPGSVDSANDIPYEYPEQPPG